ncbi:DUF6538 domain-containing protein [Yoonia rosea]|uniref:DUF6538 domain-containing protein n=1 Tax=Yoonia rosea TaxID=287098 RepID=UPI0028807D7B|nr:DUF6538 domain-containing protein [Yoonia rosea]
MYLSRRVPSDLSHHYNASRIMYSLVTRSTVVATSRAQRAAQQLRYPGILLSKTWLEPQFNRFESGSKRSAMRTHSPQL